MVVSSCLAIRGPTGPDSCFGGRPEFNFVKGAKAPQSVGHLLLFDWVVRVNAACFEFYHAPLDRDLGRLDPDLQRRPIEFDHCCLVQHLPPGTLQSDPLLSASVLSLPRPLKKGGNIAIVYRGCGYV
jgi:hypothetical protein